MPALVALAMPFAAGWLASSLVRGPAAPPPAPTPTSAAEPPGRKRVMAELAGRLGGRRAADGPPALLAIGLGGLREANATHGHRTGDRLLARAAERLGSIVRQGDVLARADGSRFALLPAGAADAAEASRLAGRVVELLSRPFLVERHGFELTPRAGVALAPHDGDTPDLLWRSAHLALDAARAGGAPGWAFYARQMHERLEERHSLAADLKRAIVRRDLALFFQPQQCSRTGAWTGAEALVRWHHPERGPVSPGDFIPLAEELGLVGALGDWVLRTACRAATGWPDGMTVAVNLSPRQLDDAGLPARVAEILRQTGLAPHRLELELTETALMRDERVALDRLRQLAALGVRLALDDFGTGYSSLSTLHRFPFQRVKIDRSFVMRLPSDEAGSGIVRAIAALGGELGLKVTAEGVETDAQRLFMQRIGCDELQGFLLARPMAHDAVDRLFRERLALAG